MVLITENKLIVEIKTIFPVEDLQNLQKEIINVIQWFDYDNYGQTNGCPFLHLLNLLQSTLPTHHQQRHVLELTNWVRDPEPDKGEFEVWLQKSTDWIKNEKE